MYKVINEFELPCYDGRKSFYGKAIVRATENGDKYLFSYETLICKVDVDKNLTKFWNGYSATTMRHINSFMEHYNMPRLKKSEWDKIDTQEVEYLW